MALVPTFLADPPAPDGIHLFNQLREEAGSLPRKASLLNEIPALGADASREELILWTQQLRVAFRSTM